MDTFKSVLHSLPLGRYQGPIYLVQSLALLDRVLASLEKERLLGFDTETRPAFRKGEKYLPSLLQLATHRAVYLFPVQGKGILKKLSPILENPSILKVGVAIKDDLKHLNAIYAFKPKGFLELSLLSKHTHTAYTGLRNLAGIFLGLRISKSAQTSNWAQSVLSIPQILYAATDAWISRELYFKLKEALPEQSFSSYVQEALIASAEDLPEKPQKIFNILDKRSLKEEKK